jgi:hypothetical protein
MVMIADSGVYVQRCVALNSAHTGIVDSVIDDCHTTDTDAQAVGGWNGPGPYLLQNNTLVGSHENVIFGGANPSIANLVPSDITIRRNHIFTPLSWKGVYQRKNLFELKNAARVLFEGNVAEGSWISGQTGWAVIIRDDDTCSWCYSRDVTLRKNLFKNTGAGISVVAPTGKPVARIAIIDNVLDSIAIGPYTGDQRGFQFLSGTRNVTAERNLLQRIPTAAVILEGSGGCRFVNNVLAAGLYGVFTGGGAMGTASLNAGCGTGGWVWSGMTMIGSSSGVVYPTGTTWVSSESQAPLAAQIRSTVTQATAGVVVPP